jgi:hypothetical protein
MAVVCPLAYPNNRFIGRMSFVLLLSHSLTNAYLVFTALHTELPYLHADAYPVDGMPGKLLVGR